MAASEVYSVIDDPPETITRTGVEQTRPIDPFNNVMMESAMRLFVSLLFAIILSQAGCILDSGDDGFTISGIITNEAGEPLYNITVMLGQRLDVTDTNGKYKFTKITANNYAFEADPYDVSIYRFEPEGTMLGVTENKVIDFVGYRK